MEFPKEEKKRFEENIRCTEHEKLTAAAENKERILGAKVARLSLIAIG